MCRQRSDRLTEQGETLLAVCASVKGTKQLYVTNQRILLHEIKGIVSTGNVAIIDDLPAHIALEIKSGIENLKVMSKTASAPAAKQEKDMYDVADEIRELKELLEDEIITQEEFDAKKKQLIGI